MSRWTPPTVIAPPVGAGPALFLDRDGTIIVDRDYIADPDRVEMHAGVAAQLRRAREAGYLLIGVSNQSGLGRGIFGPADLEAVMQRLHARLDAEGAALHAWFYCPHAPAEGCRCRKPRPGLVEEAAAVFRWDPGRSWVVGDKVSDVDLARRVGLRPALVRTGHGRAEESRLSGRDGVLVADDLAAAVAAILEGA